MAHARPAEAEARERFATARIAVLATVRPSGRPRLVPVTFAVEGSTIFTAVDDKPKRSPSLRRHADIGADARVTLLAQHWDEDWSRLWWVRADGTALVTAEAALVDHAAGLLRDKYDQYRRVGVIGPVIRVTVDAWTGWSATRP